MAAYEAAAVAATRGHSNSSHVLARGLQRAERMRGLTESAC